MNIGQNEVDLPPPVAPPLLAQPVTPAGPWGFWATTGLTLAVLAAMVIVQNIVSVPFVMRELGKDPNPSFYTVVQNLMYNGLLLAIASTVSAAVCTALICLFAKLRRGCSVTSYLGLCVPPAKVWLRWVAIFVGYLVLSDVVTYLSGRRIVPDFMIETYKSAGFVPLFLFALIVAAPVFEETLFRGFALPGMQRSWLGPAGAVIVTAALWASIHLQYDLFQVGQIFFMGLILGAARIRAKSVILTIGLHAIANLGATVELFVVLARGDV